MMHRSTTTIGRQLRSGRQCRLSPMAVPEMATVDLTQYAAWDLAAQLCTDQEKATRADAALQLPAYAVAVLIPKN